MKAFLLNQERVAGVGNIYADEALFRARIHPLRPVGTLKRAQIEALRDAVVEALELGIDAKGASIDDYRHIDGAEGTFQDRFLVHTARGRALPALRHADREAARGRAGDLRLPSAASGGRGVRRARRSRSALSSSSSTPARSASTQLAEAADGALSHQHLGERHLPGEGHELGAAHRVLGQVHLLVAHPARGRAAPWPGGRSRTARSCRR